MITQAISAMDEFEASIDQIEQVHLDALPVTAQSVLAGAPVQGAVSRIDSGGARRVKLWFAEGCLVSSADQGDPSLVGPALVSSGAAAVAHLVDLWVPPTLAGTEVSVPAKTLDELVTDVRSGELSVELGVIGRRSEPTRYVVVRTAGNLLMGSTGSVGSKVELRQAGLAGLWRVVCHLVSS